MLELVSAKGDARAARQSSWLSSLGGVQAKLERAAGPLRLTFAAFVLVHLALQARRAHSATALPEPGFEQAPWLVGALLALLWLPFTVFGLRTLSRSFTRSGRAARTGQAYALSIIEPLSLVIVPSLATTSLSGPELSLDSGATWEPRHKWSGSTQPACRAIPRSNAVGCCR